MIFIVSPKECPVGLVHLMHKVIRLLLRRPPTFFFNDLRTRLERSEERSGAVLTLVSNPDGSNSVCHCCGYANARLEFTNRWCIEACTAVGFNGVIGNEQVGQWLQMMDQVNETPESTRDVCQIS